MPITVFDEYRSRPIPDLSALREAKKGYRQWPIDSSHALYAEDCLESREQGIEGQNFYYRSDTAPYHTQIPGSIPQLFVRESVLKKLQQVNARLVNIGLQLFINDAWRPAPVQNYFHDRWFPDYLRRYHPDWTDSQITEEVENYWARGPAKQQDIDPLSPPPHSTGAVVDLTLCAQEGEKLWMGTVPDDVTERAHPDYFELHDELSLSDDEARRNRRLLYWIMKETDFAVNPTEWWHFSWGDQMWAKLASAETGTDQPAWYSVIDPAGSQMAG